MSGNVYRYTSSVHTNWVSRSYAPRLDLQSPVESCGVRVQDPDATSRTEGFTPKLTMHHAYKEGDE
jgi:hypothetical protein